MKIVVLGLNHKTAPLEIREKLAFDPAETSRALAALKQTFPQAEYSRSSITLSWTIFTLSSTFTKMKMQSGTC
ncbi:MAG: hypothetical protein P8Z79_18870 [Sedimentisphaerales bacterium]